MATFEIQPERSGARLTLISDDYRTSVTEAFDQSAAEKFVRMFCDVAGLPEPWKKA